MPRILRGAEPLSWNIDVRLLGPLEVDVGGARVRFDGLKQRRLFVALVLGAPRPVSADVLAEILWGEAYSAGGPQALQKHVSRLRQRLGQESPLHHRAPGYALEIDPLAIDARRFEGLLERARAALGRNDPECAAADLNEALTLWRGDVLAEHRFDNFAHREVARLEELRLEAIEERLAADLARGRDADLVGELQSLVGEHPLRERLRAHLMVALYRTGRQAEALETMRTGRDRMVGELGLEPGPELRKLEHMILAQDPDLSAERPRSLLSVRLPTPATETVGRSGDLKDVCELLIRPGVRLVTLVGPGGVGKTRLAMEAARAVAERFPGGAVRVDLDGVDEVDVLVPEAATALGFVANRPTEFGEQLARATGGSAVLLVLDGFERFIEDAGQVSPLLAEVANLTVLVTSRAPLRITAEHVYRVHPLTVIDAATLALRPGEGGRPCELAARRGHRDPRRDLRSSRRPAAGDRAGRRPRPAATAAGAARTARTPTRAAHRWATRPTGPPALAAGDTGVVVGVARPPERRLLGRLTLFEGGASLEAAAAVFNGAPGGGVEAVVGSLVDNSSLLRTDSGRDADPRFRMLDTVREFAYERAIESDDLDAIGLRHARFFLDYCEHAAEQAARSDRRHWLDRLAQERGNIRVAFERLLRAGAVDEALRLAIAFARALPWDAHAYEVRGLISLALAAETPVSLARRASAMYWDGRLALSQGRYADAEWRLAVAA